MYSKSSYTKKHLTLPIMLCMTVTSHNVHAEVNQKHTLDIESALIYTGYNDISMPGNTGDRFSFKNDLQSEPTFGMRFRYGYQYSDKHWLGLLIAPLTIKPQGKFNKDIKFQGTTFKAGEEVKAQYRFNSYRLLYRYTVKDTDHHKLSLGGALKMRDANVTLATATKKQTKENIGFVPLISFNYTYQATDKLKFLVDGEALAAKQGRAEDVFFGAQYHVNDNLAVKGGYRVLEGGVDNDNSYNLSLFNYATLGAVFTF